ncbi:MAG TPA: hypothetical protein VMZ25_04535 [Terriglobales bacterium]|nr:hypothetical protein [Terriglobales bacterium]
MDLAIPIAERGGNAVPFLLEQLRSDSTDMTIRDILLIFETMANSKRYDVKSDLAVMSQLEKSVLMMKDKEWQDICRKRLQRMLKAD